MREVCRPESYLWGLQHCEYATTVTIPGYEGIFATGNNLAFMVCALSSLRSIHPAILCPIQPPCSLLFFMKEK